VFALLQSWHNHRALDPAGEWHRLTISLAYSTEAQLRVHNANHRAFSIGTHLNLEDFTLEQVSELNSRYGSPLQSDGELDSFFRLVGGHPYLTSCSLVWMREHRLSLTDLEAEAERDEGLFSNHLRGMLNRIIDDEPLREAMRCVLNNQPCLDADGFYRLRNAGIIIGDSIANVRPRCRLYTRHLEKHLLRSPLKTDPGTNRRPDDPATPAATRAVRQGEPR
jgi:hypothetical protein